MARLLGEILLADGIITEQQLADALETQADKGGRIGEVLIHQKACHEKDVLIALAHQLDLPFAESINIDDLDLSILMKITIKYAKENLVLPLRQDLHGIYVVCADPLNYQVLDDLTIHLSGQILPVIAPSLLIFDTINMIYDKAITSPDQAMSDLEEGGYAGEEDLDEIEDLVDITDEEAPIIRLVNVLLKRAVKERASDIHIEPFENEVLIRYRIDGVLYEVLKPPKRIQNAVTSRVKVMAKLDIAEKRLPQDGRIRIKIAGKDIDIRTSVIPTAHGERVVMRLLDKSTVRLDMVELGMDDDILQKMLFIISKPHGICLVTGPTGSGKTTTLYAALVHLNSPDVNILTVEDPIEYQIQGIGQMQVNPKINLTFASGLRHFLRQDPDIILVGEIRDLETAEIAIQASLTGHLVFSTLHTNDSATAITRLVDMGVEPFLVSSSLEAVLAQRLIRLLCNDCKKAYIPKPSDLEKIGIEVHQTEGINLYNPVGCPICTSTGYKGRAGIFELLEITDEIRSMVLANVDSTTIKKKALQNGMRTLRDDGAFKVLAGKTSLAEIFRITQVDFA